MVAVWAEQNNSDKYDIYSQKFDYKGDKVGETLLVRNHSDSHLTNLPTNEFTLNNDGPNLSIRTPHGLQDSSGQSISDGSIWNTSIGNNTREGLQYLKLNDGSYVTAWQETQDGQSTGIGYQRFDSEGNALASELIRHKVPKKLDSMPANSSNISIEAGQGSNDFTVSLNNW